MKRDETACRELADAKRFEEQRKGGKSAAPQPRAVDGAAAAGCALMPKGRRVTVDESQGAFACVRAKGDLDCLWAAKASIDEHAGFEAQPLSRPSSPMPSNRSPANGPITRGASETVNSGFRFNDPTGGGGALR